MQILFDIYDATGGLTVGDTEVVVAFDTARYLNSYTSLSSGEMTVKLPPSRVIPPECHDMLLTAKIGYYVSSGSARSITKAWIEVDTGGGYAVIPGTDCFAYDRNNSARWSSTVTMTSYQIDKQNSGTVKFRIRTQRVDGSNTITTLASASNFVCIMNV